MKMFNIKRSVVLAAAAFALTAGAASTAKADDWHRGRRSYYSYRDYGCGPRYQRHYSSYYRSDYGPRYFRGHDSYRRGGFGFSFSHGRSGWGDGHRHGGHRRGYR